MNIDPFTDGIMTYCTTVGFADSENDRVVFVQRYDGLKNPRRCLSSTVHLGLCLIKQLGRGKKMTLILKSGTEVLQLSSAGAGHP